MFASTFPYFYPLDLGTKARLVRHVVKHLCFPSGGYKKNLDSNRFLNVYTHLLRLWLLEQTCLNLETPILGPRHHHMPRETIKALEHARDNLIR